MGSHQQPQTGVSQVIRGKQQTFSLYPKLFPTDSDPNVGTLRGRAGEVVEILVRRKTDKCRAQETR